MSEMHRVTAFRNRSFRLLWIATLFSSTARWADVVVIGWLTLVLTDSAFMVGIVAACKMAGYIAAPFMGVIADRVDRRLLLIVASAVNLIVSVTMLVLFVFGWLLLWHLIVLALASSFTWAIDNPARQALVADLVEIQDLTNAIALNAVAVEITVVVGPALGGLLIPALGIGGAYGLIAAIYVMDVSVLLRMKSGTPPAHRAHEPPARSLVAGFRYARENQTVLVLLVIAFMLNLAAAPYRYSFLPLFARYVLDAGPTGYGMLTAGAGFGALVAGLWFVTLGNVKGKGRLVVWSSFGWPLSLLLFAMSSWYYVSLALVFAAGFTQAIAWTVIATLMLSHTTESMRGRIMGLRTGVVIALPFGNFLAGAAAERFGAPLALGAYSASAMLIMLAIVLLAPNLYRSE